MPIFPLRACSVQILLLLLALKPLIAAQNAQELEQENIRIHKQIERWRPIAERIRVDGWLNDWQGLPYVQDERSLPLRNFTGLDLMQVAIAPVEHGVYLMARTRGTSPRQNGNFWISLDLAGEEDFDFAVGICWDKPHQLEIYTPGAENERSQTTQLQAAIKEGLEVFIPYDTLLQAVPAHLRQRHPFAVVKGKTAPWIRARFLTWSVEHKKTVRADPGLAVASFTYKPTPYPLEREYLKATTDPVRCTFPLKGQWYLSQGPFGAFSHQARWAYDLQIYDEAHHVLPYGSSEDGPLENYYAFGQPILASAAGTVLKVQSKAPDRKAGKAESVEANAVILRDEKGFQQVFVHLQQHSIMVQNNTRVVVGQELGRVGNSGFTTRPHLHFHIVNAQNDSQTVAFENVRVALNRTNCPWQRNLKCWLPTEGFFIESLVNR